MSLFIFYAWKYETSCIFGLINLKGLLLHNFRIAIVNLYEQFIKQIKQ